MKKHWDTISILEWASAPIEWTARHDQSESEEADSSE